MMNQKTTTSKNLMPFALVITLLLVGVDQVIKHAVATHISLGQTVNFIPGLMELMNLHNTGAAWSLLEGRQSFFTIITLIAIPVILYFMWKTRTKIWQISGLTLILAGAVGNFIDRLLHGYVVDMFALQFINFPIFNFADVCLTVGVFISVILILKEDD